MTGPSDIGGSDSLSRREDWVINSIASMTTELRALSRRLDDFANRTDQNFEIAFRKQDRTNGNVQSLERWRERLEGGRAVTGAIQGRLATIFASVISSVVAAVLIIAVSNTAFPQ